MNTKMHYLLPAFAAVFALMFTLAAPYVMAEPGEDRPWKDDAKPMWKVGMKHHKKHMAIQVEGFVGSIPIPEEMDKDARKTLKDQVTVSLSEAASGLDVKKGGIGVAVNENGQKFLVWKLVSIEKSDDSKTATKTIHVVDAGDSDNTTTVTKELDKPRHHSMKAKFADLTPEEREAKIAQFKEMKAAFDALTAEEQAALKSHFKGMKDQHADLTPEELEAKHAEFKSQMNAFMGLSLDEKINYLKNLAKSAGSQA